MKKTIFIVICGFLLITIYSITKSIIEIWHKQRVLSEASADLGKLKKENETLKKQLENTKQPGFKEEIVRNKLFLVRENEKIVLIQEDAIKKNLEIKINNDPVYIQWLKIFKFI